VLEDGHDPSIREGLGPAARDVDVPRSVLHHDDQLGGIRVDLMHPAVQWPAVEDRALGPLIQRVSHGIMVSNVPQTTAESGAQIIGVELDEDSISLAQFPQAQESKHAEG
jgi:hypothetical protein